MRGDKKEETAIEVPKAEQKTTGGMQLVVTSGSCDSRNVYATYPMSAGQQDEYQENVREAVSFPLRVYTSKCGCCVSSKPVVSVCPMCGVECCATCWMFEDFICYFCAEEQKAEMARDNNPA